MRRLFIGILVLTFFAVIAAANVPAPFSAGEAGFEPVGFGDFGRVTERITIDMTGIVDAAPVKIVNAFEIENDNSPKKIRLMFPSVRDLVFELDGAVIEPAVSEPPTDFKSPWAMPSSTFWVDGKSLGYSNNNRAPDVFSITIPPGRHTLTIRESLTPSRNVSGRLTKYWQFAFVMLPFDARKSIKETTVEIKTPPTWDTVVMPEFAGQNGVYVGKIGETLPKALLITTKMPVPDAYATYSDYSDYALIAALFAFPAIALVLCWVYFSKLRFWWLFGILFSLSWTVISVIAAYFAQFGAAMTIPEAQQANYGYGDIGSVILILIVAVGTLFCGFPLWLGTWFAAKKMRERKAARVI